VQVIKVPIDQLRPFEKNPRQHGDDVKFLIKSIEKYGWTNPILVQKGTMRIVAGHGRLLAAKEKGLTEVPVIELDLDDRDATAYTIADNKSAEKSQWNLPNLKELLVGLDDGGFDLDLTGFDELELEKLITSETNGQEDVPDVPAKPITNRGDLWALGPHRLLCGDAVIFDDVKTLMRDELGDMIFTDPPYSVGYQEKAKNLNARIGTGANEKPIKNDDLTEHEAKVIWENAFKNYFDFTTAGASYYCTSPQGGTQMELMFMISKSWLVKHQLIWVKDSLVLGRSDYHYRHEPIIYGWKEGSKHLFYGDRKQTSVWEFKRPRASKLHPTMKPVELIEKAIKNSSRRNNLVLDFFGGAGSTLMACEKTNRVCRMMELDPQYCDVIVKRWQNSGGKAKRIK